MPVVRLITLGQWRLTAPARIYDPGKPLALLTYLALAPGFRARRDVLLDLLWSDAPSPESARHTLRETVRRIRADLGQTAIAARGSDLVLVAPVEIDRDAFLQAIHRKDLAVALSLYGGDFLPECEIKGGLQFEQWALVERGRLRMGFIRARVEHARSLMERGRYREAHSIAQQVHAANPIDQTGMRLLLETAMGVGNHVSCQVEADRLELILEVEEHAPEPATRHLLRTARQMSSEAEPATPPMVAELVAREHEFAALIAGWKSVVSGAGGNHVHVLGAPGIGKTRLLTDVQARLRAMGGRVMYVKAFPGEQRIPYALASQLAAVLGRLPGAAGISPECAAALVDLNPSLATVFRNSGGARSDGDAMRRRLVAIMELLLAVSEDRTVAIIIDDLHWADEESWTLLAAVGHRVREAAALLVTAGRPGGRGVPPGADAVHELSRLSATSIAELLASLASLPASPWAQALPFQLEAATRGVPFLVMDTLHLLIDRGSLRRGEHGWEALDIASLAQLEEGSSVRHRVRTLEPSGRSLTLLVALLGRPVSTDLLVRLSGASRDATLTTIHCLDRSGFLRMEGSDVVAAHDEIARAAIDGATVTELRDANRRIGTVLLEDARGEVRELLRAGPFLVAGEESDSIRRGFRELVESAHRRGDSRPPRELARDFVGPDAGDAVTGDLLSRLPLTRRPAFRAGLRASGLAVVATMAAAFALDYRLLERAGATTEIVAIGLTEDGSVLQMRAAVTHRDRAGQLVLEDVSRLPTERAAIRAAHWNTRRSAWLFDLPVPDSGVIDVFIAEDEAPARRLTFSRGDDIHARWSPDGRFVAYSTREHDPRSHTDLVVLDVETGHRRILTRSDANEGSYVWAPDGTSIHFIRAPSDGSMPHVCRIAFDASWEECRSLPARVSVGSILATADGERLLLFASDSAGSYSLGWFDTGSGAWTQLLRVSGEVFSSEDGRWLVCRCIADALPERGWYLVATEEPQRPVAIQWPEEVAEVSSVMLRTVPAHSHYLDTLRIRSDGSSIRLGVPHRLSVYARDASGMPVRMDRLRWRTSDTTVATVDDSGVVHARRPGAVLVTVSAGGWRTDSTRVEVLPPVHQPAFVETWDEEPSRFLTFGVPEPTTSRDSKGNGILLVNGDGSYFSGVISPPVDASDGLGLEVMVSTPIMAPQWQLLRIEFTAQVSEPRLRSWDRKSGNPPVSTNAPADRTCSTTVPSGEGARWLDHRSITAAFEQLPFRVAEEYRTGRWHRVRLQLFADGRCGVALDGVPKAITSGRVRVDVPYRVVIAGQSVNTNIAVGRTELWKGVRSGVDWSRLGSDPLP